MNTPQTTTPPPSKAPSHDGNAVPDFPSTINVKTPSITLPENKDHKMNWSEETSIKEKESKGMSEILIKCKACSGEMSADAKMCPKCGKPNKKMGCLAKAGLAFLGLIILSIAIRAFNTASEPSPTPSSGTQTDTASLGKGENEAQSSKTQSPVTDLASLPVLSRKFFGIQLGEDASNLVARLKQQGIEVTETAMCLYSEKPSGLANRYDNDGIRDADKSQISVEVQRIRINTCPTDERSGIPTIYSYKGKVYLIDIRTNMGFLSPDVDGFLDQLAKKYPSAEPLDEEALAILRGKNPDRYEEMRKRNVPFGLNDGLGGFIVYVDKIDGHPVTIGVYIEDYVHVRYSYLELRNIAGSDLKTLNRQAETNKKNELEKKASSF